MRVLLVNTTEENGGAAIAANRLKAALINHGVQAKFLVAQKKSNNISVVGLTPKWKYLWHFLWERWGIFVAQGFSKRNLFAIDTASAGTDITRLPEFQEADVIHLHWTNQGFLSLKNIRNILRSGKPIVWTLHDMWAFTGICHYTNDCQNYKSECANCPLLRYAGKKDLANRTFRKKQKIYAQDNISFVAVSSWLATQAQSSGLLRNHPFHVIANVLPISRFTLQDKTSSRAASKLPLKPFILLFGAVKIEDARKGLNFLLDALRLLIDSGRLQREQLHLVLFGGNKNPEIFQQIPVEYTFQGFVNDDKLATLYAASDVAVIPSRYETFGQTVIEAQACGCPPVTFTGSGQMDIIEHKVNGYLAQEQSAEDLAEGICWALEERPDPAVLRSNVLKNFSENAIAQKYINVYEQALNSTQK